MEGGNAMATRIGGTLKKLMHARIVASGGDFAARVAFAEEDFAAAATESITRRQCLDWIQHLYQRHGDGEDRKAYLMMNELSEDEPQNVIDLYIDFWFKNIEILLGSQKKNTVVNRIFITCQFNDDAIFSNGIRLMKKNGSEYAVHDQYTMYNLNTKEAEIFIECDQIRCNQITKALEQQAGAKSIQVNTFSNGGPEKNGAIYAYNRITNMSAREGFTSAHFGTRRLITPPPVAIVVPKITAAASTVIDIPRQFDKQQHGAPEAAEENAQPQNGSNEDKTEVNQLLLRTLCSTTETIAANNTTLTNTAAEKDKAIATLASLSNQLLQQCNHADKLRREADGRLGSGVQQANAPVREENAQLRRDLDEAQKAMAEVTAKLNFTEGQRDTDRIKIESLEADTARITDLKEENARIKQEKEEANTHFKQEKAQIKKENARLKQEDGYKRMEIDRLIVELAKRPPYAKGEPRKKVSRERQDAIARTIANYLRAIMGVTPYDDVPLYAEGDPLTYVDMLAPIQSFADARGTLKPSKAVQIGKAMLDIGITGHTDGSRAKATIAGHRRMNISFNIVRVVAALQKSSF